MGRDARKKDGRPHQPAFGVQAPRHNVFQVHPSLRNTFLRPDPARFSKAEPASYRQNYGDFDPPALSRLAARTCNWESRENQRYTLAYVLNDRYLDLAKRRKAPPLPPTEVRYKHETFLDIYDRKPRSQRAYFIPQAEGEPRKHPAPSVGHYLRQEPVLCRYKLRSGTFPFTSGVPRFTKKSKKLQGPGAYKLKDPLGDVLKKRTGKKGPYELFTVPTRDERSYTGHQRALPKAPVGPGSYLPFDCLLKRLNHTKNKMKGVWHWRGHEYKPPITFSAPGMYDIKIFNRGGPAFYVPFGSTRRDSEPEEMPGPGRYTPKSEVHCPFRNTHKSSFKSRKNVPRSLEDFWASRQREFNIPKSGRANFEPPFTDREHIAASHYIGRKAIIGMD